MNFFQMEDRPEDVAHAANQEYAVFIQDGNFKWNRSIQSLTHNTMEEMDHHFQLRSINMNVKKGKQILVVGRTGCGKTSLMYSIMGELHGLGC
jgi:ABC-type transport system involved in cytochrome bd biosynthesis fused ATPase/permease subunit